MTTLIVGASAGLGRALSEALAGAGHDLLLVASDYVDLDVQAQHLRTVHGVDVTILASDVGSLVHCVRAMRACAENLPAIDGLCFPVGVSSDDDRLGASPEEIERILDVNFRAVVGMINEFLPAMLERGDGFVIGFGSIAAIRGRRANIVYAAAKRALASYFESIRHAVVGTRVRVHFYRLGYVDTSQSFGRKLLFPPASPESVARAVLRDLRRGEQAGYRRNGGSRYLPRWWALVACAVALLPWSLYKRLDF